MLLILDQSPSLPVITGFSPASGPVTTVIRVALQSGGVGITAAAVGGTAADFVVESDTVVRVTVPGGATSGLISLTNAAGSALSTTEFTVSAAPLDLSGATDGQLLQRVSGAIAGVNVGSGLEIVSGALRWIVQRLDQFLPPTNPVDFGGQKAVGLGTPTASTDAATKNYVDTLERVTSVGLSVPAILDVTGSPITAAGTIALSLISQAANRFFAGPTSGGNATPAFRALVPDDFGTGLVGGFLRKDEGGVMSWATPAGGGGGGGAVRPIRPGRHGDIGVFSTPVGAATARTLGSGVNYPANSETLWPFVWPEELTLADVGFTVNGSATVNCRISIYSNQIFTVSGAPGPNSAPGSVLMSTSTISFSVTGAYYRAITPLILTPGIIYWLSYWQANLASNIVSIPVDGVLPLMGSGRTAGGGVSLLATITGFRRTVPGGPTAISEGVGLSAYAGALPAIYFNEPGVTAL